MSYQDIRDAREGFVRSDIGDGMIKVESVIIGIITFFLLINNDMGFFKSLMIAILVIAVTPVLVGLIKPLAIVAAILFSIIWGYVGYVIGCLATNDNIFVGVIGFIILCSFSLLCHRVFSGLGFQSVEKHVIDSIDQTRDNTAEIRNNQSGQNEVHSSSDKKANFCSNCGIKIEFKTKFCPECGNKL